MRAVNLVLVILALASAFALYDLKYDTRRMEVRVHVLERALDKALEDLAQAKAQKAHLSRPERIEPLARALGLVPIGARNYVRIETPAVAATDGK